MVAAKQLLANYFQLPKPPVWEGHSTQLAKQDGGGIVMEGLGPPSWGDPTPGHPQGQRLSSGEFMPGFSSEQLQRPRNPPQPPSVCPSGQDQGGSVADLEDGRGVHMHKADL